MDKESFVGPKTVNVYFKDMPSTPVAITYQSSIALAKAIKMSKGEIEGDLISVWNGLNRISYNPRDVVAFMFDKADLNRKSSKVFLGLEILFDNGVGFELKIAGENRLRIIYKQLEEMVGKAPSSDSLWFVIPQEQNKIAHIKYLSTLTAIRSRTSGV